MASTFPGSADVFKTIPTPTTTPTNLSDASDDTLSTRLQQHSDAILAVENYLIAAINSAEVTGVVKAFAGSVAPAGYLLCNGAAVSRTTFSALFGVTGTSYGIGDGSTTFNVPNLSGSVPVGTGTAPGGVTSRVLGAAGGQETHVLTTAELAAHSHTVSDPSHNHGHSDPGHVHGYSDPGHVHGINDAGHAHGYINAIASSPGSSLQGGTTFQSASAGTNASGTGISIQSSGIGITISAAGTGMTNVAAVTGITTANSGSGTAHNNMQPFCVFAYIIKT